MNILEIKNITMKYQDINSEVLALDNISFSVKEGEFVAVQLDEKLPEADFVISILPQTTETIGLFDERRLRLMKDDAVLINGGRGSLIDQEALLKVMSEGKFFGVGLDVTTPEPLPKENPLWKQERLLITPHAAGNSCSLKSPLERKIRDFHYRF